jgi:hypothetical protein
MFSVPAALFFCRTVVAQVKESIAGWTGAGRDLSVAGARPEQVDFFTTERMPEWLKLPIT